MPGISKDFLQQFAADHGFTISHVGKVGVTFLTDDPALDVIVRTDHVSAFNSVWPGVTVPGKGIMLTKSAVCWFRYFGGTHFVSDDPAAYPGQFGRFPEVFAGRSILIRHFAPEQMLPVESIVRGNLFIEGNGAVEYREKGTICGIKLPAGIKSGWEPPVPLFTPTDKSETDDNLPFPAMVKLLGQERAETVRDTSLTLFRKARERMLLYGLLLADTKFEFAWDGDQLTIVDEIFSPDTTRAWDALAFYNQGKIVSTDKQILRDYINASGWKKGGDVPPPPLTEELVERTQNAYIKFYLTVKAATTGVNPADYDATLEADIAREKAVL